MGSKGPRRRTVRRTQFETLEDRQMFSAEPLGGGIEQHAPATPDFWYDTSLDRDLDSLAGDIEQTLASAHALTGVTRARNDYGFLGYGQTVAVIDSGIAWDHPNLGNGFGANARVVGGWDFTEENDANPYDDGQAGSHGTHVAGIVGATANSTGDVGVAPGVDLVGLRVFNDQGDGYFSWVEKALKWVHTNRNAFANPITAVNLSLGTAYNAATVPSWATLEDEFAQLKADGIFIAVSAGNSFSTYNAAGLSYPAASPSVVPVMSVDDSGSLSYFSQRHSRAIAAPGRSIRSTVPDYVGNQNGVTDDWANYSGTSMASPYVAGASVLVREAMQFVGMTNITEDTIYNHMMSTADSVFDAATSQSYKRLNVAAALDALVPDDEFGSTAATAHDLGAIGAAGSDVSGLIGKRDDVDFFRFTATSTGTVTFSVDTTYALDAAWTGGGAVSGTDGNTYTIQVVAGQSYTVGLSSSAGIGYFDLTVTAAAPFSFVDWGTVAQTKTNAVTVNGESWYCVTAQQAGYLTAEAFVADAEGEVNLAWFDMNMHQVAGGVTGADCERVDRLVGAGEQLFLRVSGTSDDVDIRLTNLVTVDGSTITVTGTAGDDTISFAAGSTHQLVVNGIAYEFAGPAVSEVNILGGGGRDTVTLAGSSGNETVVLRSGSVDMSGGGLSVRATGAESIHVTGGGGNDVVSFYDSAGDDTFNGLVDHAEMLGPNGEYDNHAHGFGRVTAYATAGGQDRAMLYDSAGDDRLTARTQRVTLALAGGRVFEVNGFEQTRTDASSGTDTADFVDSAGNDVYSAWSTRASMSGAGYENEARNFDRTAARSSEGGSDQALFYDTAGDDTYVSLSARAYMAGNGYFNDTRGFARTTAVASAGGYDRAVFEDSIGDDVYAAWSDRAYMAGKGYNNEARGFDRTDAYASSGHDQALLYDSAGDDVYVSLPPRAYMSGTGYFNDTRGFDRVTAFATGGYDRAVLQDSSGDDAYVAWSDRAYLAGNGFYSDVRGFDLTSAYASAGNDRAVFYDSVGDDLYSAWSNRATMSGAGYRNEARDFDRTNAFATSGNDQAVFYDTIGDDVYAAWSDRAVLYGAGYMNDARGFDRTTAYATAGGNDRALLYDSTGQDSIVARAWGACLVGEGYSNESRGFKQITGHLINGGVNTADLEAVDYLFNLAGQWS